MIRLGILPLVCCLSGCATESRGLLIADTYAAGDATIVRTRGFGGLLGFGRQGAALGLGYKERFHVFVVTEDETSPNPGRTYFHARLPASPPIMTIDTLIGAEIAWEPSNAGWTIGMRQAALVTPIAADAAIARTMTIDLLDPARSIVRIKNTSTDGGDEP